MRIMDWWLPAQPTPGMEPPILTGERKCDLVAHGVSCGVCAWHCGYWGRGHLGVLSDMALWTGGEGGGTAGSHQLEEQGEHVGGSQPKTGPQRGCPGTILGAGVGGKMDFWLTVRRGLGARARPGAAHRVSAPSLGAPPSGWGFRLCPEAAQVGYHGLVSRAPTVEPGDPPPSWARLPLRPRTPTPHKDAPRARPVPPSPSPGSRITGANSVLSRRAFIEKCAHRTQPPRPVPPTPLSPPRAPQSALPQSESGAGGGGPVPLGASGKAVGCIVIFPGATSLP